MSKHSPRTIILLGGGLLLSAILVLLGAGVLLFGIIDLAGTLLMDRIDSYTWPLVLCPVGLGLALLTPGIFWLRACIRDIRGKGGTAELPPPERGTIPLEPPQARVAAGLCAKCGSQVAPTDQNCPSCRINLAWAREHLDELAGSGRATPPDGTVHK